MKKYKATGTVFMKRLRNTAKPAPPNPPKSEPFEFNVKT
jgi:hypothetical protein